MKYKPKDILERHWHLLDTTKTEEENMAIIKDVADAYAKGFENGKREGEAYAVLEIGIRLQAMLNNFIRGEESGEFKNPSDDLAKLAKRLYELGYNSGQAIAEHEIKVQAEKEAYKCVLSYFQFRLGIYKKDPNERIFTNPDSYSLPELTKLFLEIIKVGKEDMLAQQSKPPQQTRPFDFKDAVAVTDQVKLLAQHHVIAQLAKRVTELESKHQTLASKVGVNYAELSEKSQNTRNYVRDLFSENRELKGKIDDSLKAFWKDNEKRVRDVELRNVQISQQMNHFLHIEPKIHKVYTWMQAESNRNSPFTGLFNR